MYDHINPDYYLKDTTNEINKYEGTWKWIDGNREFQLILIKQKHHFNQTGNDNYYKDRLVGYYKYWENGALIADTSGEDMISDYGISVSFHTNCDSQEISTSVFTDVKKEKMITVILEKLSPTQMKFKGKIDQHSSYVSPTKPRTLYTGSTFPLDMVFTKQ